MRGVVTAFVPILKTNFYLPLDVKCTITKRTTFWKEEGKLVKAKSSFLLQGTLTKESWSRNAWHGKRHCVTSTLTLKPESGAQARSRTQKKWTAWRAVAAIVVTGVGFRVYLQIVSVEFFHVTARPISSSLRACSQHTIAKATTHAWRLRPLNS